MSEVANRALGAAVAPRAAAPLRRYGVWVATAVLFLVLPHVFTSGTAITLMTLIGISIVFALSYNMLMGQTGLLSFGHAVFYGLGGFLAVHGMNVIIHEKLPVPVPLVPLIGAAAGLLFGIIFGSVATRRAQTAFAMISLGIGEMVASSALILRGFFGGEEGITTNRTRIFHLLGLNFGPQIQVYYVVAAWCLVAMILMYALTRTPFGRMCVAVRENPERAQFVGYNTRVVRFMAFALSGLFAGLAGGLTAIQFEIMNSVSVGAQQSGSVLLMTYIGGVGNFAGPVLGAILITYLQVMLSGATEVWQLYLGLLFVGTVMFAPDGMAGLIMRHQPLWQGRTLHRVLPSYVLTLVPGLVTLAGLALLIELVFHVAVKASEGPAMTFLYVGLNSNSPLPWIVGGALLVGGFLAFRATWPIVANAWGNALAEARERLA
jgi:branched-chain amino acid transport system permease protein